MTSGSVRAAGLEVAVEASVHTVEGLVDALVGALGGEAPGAQRIPPANGDRPIGCRKLDDRAD